MSELPRETITEILLHTDGYTLGKCRRVCRTWKELIDGTDYIWHKMCLKEHKYTSKIAKKKSSNDCKWFYIYRNIKRWCDSSIYERKIKEFYKFNVHAKTHILDVNYGVLTVKDANGICFYDTSNFKYIPINIPDIDCLKMENNDTTTVIFLNNKILVQRTVDSPLNEQEATFIADNFVLTEDVLYFYRDLKVFKCDIFNSKLKSELIFHSDYVIKDLQCYDGKICLFTKCGKFLSFTDNNCVNIQPMKCLAEWLNLLKHICLVDEQNFVCYSRNLFKIETYICSHLYFHFPHITTLLFYGDMVLIGAKTGEILLYKLFENKKAAQPIFHTLAKLPNNRFASKLDVCERKSGSVVIVSTFLELYIIDMNFYPNERQIDKTTYSKSKIDMYKRLLKLKERLKNT